MKFKQVDSNEWEYPVMKGYKMACCDCGLVHNIDFEVIKQRKIFKSFKNGTQDSEAIIVSNPAYKVRLRAFRNNKSTGQIRRHKERGGK